jgi:two-component system response regulator ChvI
VIKHDELRVSWQGIDVQLTRGEFRVIVLLGGAPGTYRTYRSIYDVLQAPGFIAGPDGAYTANVRNAIKRLRQKFKAVDPGFDRITNYSGFGYVWQEA